MYNSETAKNYWQNRILSNDSLNSVLSYAESEEVNKAYDNWEKAVIGKEFSNMQEMVIFAK